MVENSEKKISIENSIEAKKAPLVSVLIPSYNHERYIIDCLESVKSSDYENLELILLDDGSDDRTYGLAKDWIDVNKDRFSRVVCARQENSGICQTLNSLVSSSRGEYLTAVASDDQLLPSGISFLVSCAIKNNAGQVLSDAELIDENGALIESSAFKYFGKNPAWLEKKSVLNVDILLNWNPPYQSFFVKKVVFDELGGYNQDYSFEDRDFCLRAMFKSNVVLCPNSTWRYRIRLSNRVTPGLLKEDILSDLYSIHRDNLCHAKGLNRLVLATIVLSEEQFSFKVLLAKMAIKSFRIFLKIIYWLPGKKSSAFF